MFTLSFGKILVLILVIVTLWRGMRIFNFLKNTLAGDPEQERVRDRQRTAARPAQELIECPKCGTYVPNGTFCVSKERCSLRQG
jgi:ribosomal protein L32